MEQAHAPRVRAQRHPAREDVSSKAGVATVGQENSTPEEREVEAVICGLRQIRTLSSVGNVRADHRLMVGSRVLGRKRLARQEPTSDCI